MKVGRLGTNRRSDRCGAPAHDTTPRLPRGSTAAVLARPDPERRQCADRTGSRVWPPAQPGTRLRTQTTGSGSGGMAELVKATAERRVSGDLAGFATVYDLHVPVVFGLALRITGCREAAEEVTQDVFLRLWSHGSEFDPGRGSLRNWLCLTAHSRAVGWVRREVAQKDRAARAARLRATLGSSHPFETEVDAAVDACTETAAIRTALATLSAAQSDAVVLVYFSGLTHFEVARALDIPLGTAKTRIRSGLRQLGKALGQPGVAGQRSLSEAMSAAPV